jgi:gamma-glutamyltranspeptidase/glutathione hydrolase
MVATSHPLAAAEALTLLREGGNALDAAIAGAVLLGVCEPQMTGIGGDCFALIKPAGSNEVVAVNGSGRAPAALSADALRAEGLSVIDPGHPASVTIPGAVHAFCAMSERFGRAGLDRCLAPAIQYFDSGVPVAPRAAFDMAPGLAILTPAARKHFLNNGAPFGVGDRFALPGHAEVLRRISKEGAKAFYEGEVAEDMLSALRAIGGCHGDQDFAATQTEFAIPVFGHYKGTELLEHPPNGQGAAAILLTQILAGIDQANLDPFSAQRLHLIAEATKLAYDARNRLIADPDHVTALERMLDPVFARKLGGLIDPHVAMPSVAPLTEALHKDTVLITTVDRDGMAVSLIYSIFTTFGAGVASEKFGILFHNRGSGFNLISGHPNEAGPGKRPLHTIIPAMTRSGGKIDMTFGVMGGQYQAAGHAHVLSNMIDFDMDVQEALDTPRVFASPEGLWVEDNLPNAVLQKLKSLGHKLVHRRLPIGGGQAIRIDLTRGVLIGGSDPRKDGIALGY